MHGETVKLNRLWKSSGE